MDTARAFTNRLSDNSTQHEAAEFELKVFTDLADVEPLWRELEQTAIMSGYHRFDFLEAWQSHIGHREGVVPFIVVGLQDETPVFLWPMGVSSYGPWRIARWMGGKHVNFNLGLYSPDIIDQLDGAAVNALLLRSVNAGVPIDAFELFNQPERWMERQNPFLHLPHQPSPSFAYSLQLEENFENLLERQRQSRTRRKLRRQDRKLVKQGGYKCVSVDDPLQAHRVLDVFAEQKAKRFATLGLDNTFAEPGVMDFFHELVDRAACQGVPIFKMSYLEVDGVIRATYGGTVCRGRYSANINSIAMDELARFSPGELLLGYLIRLGCENGLRWFDLGVGEAQYKRAWCDTTEALFDSFIPMTSSGQVWASIESLRQRVKRSIKQNPVTWGMVQKLRKARAN